MNAKLFGALLAAPLAAVSAMIMAAPASAAVFFNNGDSINLTGSFKAPAPLAQYEFGKVGGTFASIGSYGNFGIQAPPNSTGAFAPFGALSNGAVLASNEILSVDFADSTTYLNKEFLRVSNGVDSFKFIVTGLANPSQTTTSIPLPIPFPSISVTSGVALLSGNFVSSTGSVLGTGLLTSNFTTGSNGSYSATLVVTKTVPEPSALLGLGLMVGTVFIIRRSQEVSA